MAGLIDARILQPELAGSFAAGYRGAEQARQQTQQNQQQFEMNQMKMRQLQEDRAALTDLQSKLRAAGQSDDPNMFFRALIQTGNPDYMSKGYEGLQRYKDLVAYEREFGGGAPANAMAAPAAAAPATNVPAPAVEGMFSPPSAATVEAERQQGRLARINQMAAAGVTLDAAAPGLPAPAANALTPTNALAPTAAAPVTNAMAAATPDVNALMRRYNLASRAGSPDAAVILKQVEAALKANKMSLSDRFVPVGNLVFDRQTEKYITPTEAQLAMTRAQQQPRAPIAVLIDGVPTLVSPENAVGKTPFSPAAVQVLGLGPGREPPAPTVTQIQDPADPSRMLTIDARRYQGGSVGSPGVIGASGKAAPVQAAAVKQEQGLTKADDILTQLQSAYAQLKERKAIPSEQTNALTNIWASIASSGVGQVAGRTVGTAAQTQRDIIQSSRNQLLLAIKDATGLSAQQLNSNMELQTWLSSLTDPTRSIEANEAILQNVRRFIDSGGKYTARKDAGAAPAAAPAGGATGGNLSPAEQAELDQLRARFGKNKP